MITNASITIYHKEIDSSHNETWKSNYYDNVWAYEKKSSNSNNGLSNSNSIEIRIPFRKINAKIGDIVIIGKGKAISKSTDVNGYLITSIQENNFGSQPHIHLRGE